MTWEGVACPAPRGTHAAMTTTENRPVVRTAVDGACLALYDMAKSLDRSIEIREIVLIEKTGGRSGTYRRQRA